MADCLSSIIKSDGGDHIIVAIIILGQVTSPRGSWCHHHYAWSGASRGGSEGHN